MTWPGVCRHAGGAGCVRCPCSWVGLVRIYTVTAAILGVGGGMPVTDVVIAKGCAGSADLCVL